MRPVSVTLNALGVSEPVVVDQYQDSFKLGLHLIVEGSLTVTVQNSPDDPFEEYQTDYNTDAVWFDTLDMTNVTANTQGNIFFPVRAVRLRVSAFNSGSARLIVLQPTET